MLAPMEATKCKKQNPKAKLLSDLFHQKKIGYLLYHNLLHLSTSFHEVKPT